MVSFDNLPIIDEGESSFDDLPVVEESTDFDNLPIIEEDSTFDNLPIVDEPQEQRQSWYGKWMGKIDEFAAKLTGTELPEQSFDPFVRAQDYGKHFVASAASMVGTAASGNLTSLGEQIQNPTEKQSWYGKWMSKIDEVAAKSAGVEITEKPYDPLAKLTPIEVAKEFVLYAGGKGWIDSEQTADNVLKLAAQAENTTQGIYRELTKNTDLTYPEKLVAEGAGSMAAFLTASKFGGSYGVFGLSYLSSYGSTYMEARKHTDPANAHERAHQTAVGTALVEMWGMDKLLNPTGRSTLFRTASRALSEGTEEFTQEAWGNFIAKVGYDKTRELFENTLTSALVGGFLGGLTGVPIDASMSGNFDLIGQANGLSATEINQVKNILQKKVKTKLAKINFKKYHKEIQGIKEESQKGQKILSNPQIVQDLAAAEIVKNNESNKTNDLIGIHYGKGQLNTILPSKFGTGAQSTEMRRRVTFPELWVDQSTYYLNEQQANQGVVQQAEQQYKVPLRGKFLTQGDANWQGIQAFIRQNPDFVNKYGNDKQALQSATERMLKKQGWAGYIKTDQNTVVSFIPQKAGSFDVATDISVKIENDLKNQEIAGLTLDSDGNIKTDLDYVVGKEGITVPLEKFNMSDVTKFALSQDLQSDETIGLWVEDGVVYIDKGQNVQDKKTALYLGMKHDQQAIYDGHKNEVVEVPLTTEKVQQRLQNIATNFSKDSGLSIDAAATLLTAASTDKHLAMGASIENAAKAWETMTKEEVDQIGNLLGVAKLTRSNIRSKLTAALNLDSMCQICDAGLPGDVWLNIYEELHEGVSEEQSIRQSWLDEYVKPIGKLYRQIGNETKEYGPHHRKLNTNQKIAALLYAENLDRKANLEASRISDDTLADIRKHLTPQEQQLKDLTREFFEYAYPQVAEAYQQHTGKELPKRYQYFPSVPVKGRGTGELDYAIGEDLLKSMTGDARSKKLVEGHIKELNKNAVYPLDLDLMGHLRHYVDHMSKYIAMSKKQHTVWSNFKHIKPIIHDKFGPALANRMETAIEDVIKGVPKETTDLGKWINEMRNVSYGATLWMNPKVWANQSVSFFNGANEIGYINTIRGLDYVMNNREQAIQEMLDASSTIRGSAIDPALQEIMERRIYLDLETFNAFNDFFKKVSRAGMAPIQMVDLTTKATIFHGAKQAAIRQGMNEQQANRLAERAVEISQPMSLSLFRPELNRRGSIDRQIFAFFTQRFQNFNKIIRTENAVKNGTVSHMESIKTKINHRVIPAIVLAAISGAFFKPPEEAVKEIAEKYFGIIPYLAQFMSAIKYGRGDIELPLISPAQYVAEAGYAASQENIERAVYKSIQAFLAQNSISLRNAKNILEFIIKAGGVL